MTLRTIAFAIGAIWSTIALVTADTTAIAAERGGSTGALDGAMLLIAVGLWAGTAWSWNRAQAQH